MFGSFLLFKQYHSKCQINQLELPRKVQHQVAWDGQLGGFLPICGGEETLRVVQLTEQVVSLKAHRPMLAEGFVQRCVPEIAETAHLRVFIS